MRKGTGLTSFDSGDCFEESFSPHSYFKLIKNADSNTIVILPYSEHRKFLILPQIYALSKEKRNFSNNSINLFIELEKDIKRNYIELIYKDILIKYKRDKTKVKF